MKAIIMAGGEGSRLRPLTCGLPKPMLPVMDKPVMHYALQLLNRHGINDVSVTLAYMPDVIKSHFGADGGFPGMNISYCVEETPMGTAGGVKLAAAQADMPFVVLSGDGLTDCNIKKAIKFHTQHNALVTIVLHRVPDPAEYGVVITDENGRIKRFVEKPSAGEVFSDTINTGIYIIQPEVLGMIPDGRPYDFGKDLFSQLMENKLPLYGYVDDGYWCDIGDLQAYLQAHRDWLNGYIALDCGVKNVNNLWVAPGAYIDDNSVLEGPCFIGGGARIMPGARIGAYSVVCGGAQVDGGASIKRSVLWNGAAVRRDAQIRGAVLCRHALADIGSAIYEGGVLGDNAELGRQSVILPDVKVWPRKKLSGGMQLKNNLIWGNPNQTVFGPRGAYVDSPEAAVVIASAWAVTSNAREIAIMRANGGEADALSYAAISGIMSRGVRVQDMGIGTPAMLRRTMAMAQSSAGLFVVQSGFEFIDASGVAISRDMERRIEAITNRQDAPRAFMRHTHEVKHMQGVLDFYIADLMRDADTQEIRAMNASVAVFCANETVKSHFTALAAALGINMRALDSVDDLRPGEIGVCVDEYCEVLTPVINGYPMDDASLQTLQAYLSIKDGADKLVAPVSAPKTLEELAARYKLKVVRTKTSRNAVMSAMVHSADGAADTFRRLYVYYDALYMFLKLIGVMAKEDITLQQLTESLPNTNRAQEIVPCPVTDKARVLRELAETITQAELTDGIRVDHGSGWAIMLPTDDAGIRVIAEAPDAEFARELCDIYVKKVKSVE